MSGPEVGASLGVEEEYHVVDVETLALRSDPALVAALLEGRFGPGVQPEIATAQVEVATSVCFTLSDVRRELGSARAAATSAVALAGATILPASTHPFSSWGDQDLTSSARYVDLFERWGILALQQVICGCHVHVSVPDLDTAVAVMDHVRPYLPVLLALTGSSPFHEGTDTGYDSYRTQWFARWPVTGPPELLGTGASYLAVVEELCSTGVAEDSSHLYWDVRPSSRYPTLEFRVGDVCTSLDDAVLHAALVRSLTSVLADRARRGVPPNPIRPEVLRAARWRAARHGLSDRLAHPTTGQLLPAGEVVWALLAELEEDLSGRGEAEEVRALVGQLLQKGTSAARQRSVLHRTGDLRSVARSVVVEGTGGGGA